ncbi:MAG: glycosyltransferase family 2 protein [Prevotella sp.]|nr:glycosyltransferase family 2 protein [Candidatus Prevotella equi]
MRVSIIVPVYNASAFIVNCLSSVSSQTLTEKVECILVEDCGQDGSAQLINDYIANYTGNVSFRLLEQNKNQGPSAARNRGIREATGEYVFFLDADDQITPQCIETLYNIAKQNNADYVQGTYNASPQPSPKERESGLPQFLDNKKDIKNLLLDYSKIQFTPHNRLVRRQMILDHDLFFNEQIKVREDFLWMTFVAKYVNRFAATPVETYVRGFNEDSLTHNINREREIQGYKVLIETMCENIDPFLRGRQKNLILEALLMALRAGYYDDREYLIDKVKSINTFYEQTLLNLYLKTNSNFLLRIILKIYSLQN